MLRISLISIAACGALLSGCASSGWHTYAQAPHAAKGQQLAANSASGLICRDTAPTGSRLSKRECHTQAEWDTLAGDSLNQFNQNAARSEGNTGMQP